MGRLVLFMHVSLDGFVAGPGGEMDWIKVDEEMFDFAANRTNEADTALYGRVTYEMMEAYWPTAGNEPDASRHDKVHSSWYNRVTKAVISRSMKGQELPRTLIISEHLEDNINKLKKENAKDILMFGSPGAAHSLMELDIIDDYWLFINPILLGNGIPLFKGINEIQKLDLKATNQFSSGVVCMHHQRKR
jgi:dihydrofolate reductase